MVEQAQRSAVTPDDIRQPRSGTIWGIAALGCYSIHASYHLLHRHPEELLWACHLGAAIVGVGLIASSAKVNAVGTLFLLLGTPLWLLYLAGGGEFIPTSCFTHIAALAIGLYGAKRLGLPRGSWWKAALALVALVLICRLVTPASSNVNVSFSMYPGCEKIFPSHPVYLSTMIAIAAVYFLVAQAALRRILAR
jgi:hypothetical protein